MYNEDNPQVAIDWEYFDFFLEILIYWSKIAEQGTQGFSLPLNVFPSRWQQWETSL